MRTSPLTFVLKTASSSSSLDSVNGARPSARPGVVEEDVEASELLDRGGDEALAALRVGDVELELDVGLEPVDAPRAAGDADAGVLQRTRGRLPDSGRCAGDDRRLAGEVKCRHGAMLSPPAWLALRDMVDLERHVMELVPVVRAAAAACAARRGSRSPARRARAPRAPGSRSSPSRRGGRAPRRRRDPRRARRATSSGSMPGGRALEEDAPRFAEQRPARAQASARRRASPAIGSKRSQPVASTSAPATAVPANAARSVATCRNAPRTFRLSRSARDSTSVATRFTATPTSATTSTMPPCTSAGETSRRTAP